MPGFNGSLARSCMLYIYVSSMSSRSIFRDITYEYTSIENFNGNTLDIGWIELLKCKEGTNEESTPIYPSGYTIQELQSISEYAITVKILTGTGIPGFNENSEYAVKADICSNPVYALNNGFEMSYTLNTTNSQVIGMTNINNWIGIMNATNRLINSCYTHTPRGSLPGKLLESEVYGSYCNNGLHIMCNVSSKWWYGVRCKWKWSGTVGQNISVWIGFDLHKEKFCQHINETYQLLPAPPTISPTNIPTKYPSTHEPTMAPTYFDVKGTISCNDTIKNNFSSSSVHVYYLYLEQYSSVTFETCDSVADIAVFVTDPTGMDDVSTHCSTYYILMGGMEYPDYCGLCMNGRHMMENFTVPQMKSNKHYRIRIANNVYGNAFGVYKLNIKCTPIPDCDPIVNENINIKNNYLYYDRLNSLSQWRVDGQVSSEISSHCPLTEHLNNTKINSFIPKKICIWNSSFWDGQYQWIQYNEDTNISIYHNEDKNKYMYEQITTLGKYEYYLSDFQTDLIKSTRCIMAMEAAIGDIRDCIGKWESYYDNNWHLDTNIISTQCNDLCVYDYSDSLIPDGATFSWVYYNEIYRSNVYYCAECVDCYNDINGVYLHGYYENDSDRYFWMFSSECDGNNCTNSFANCLWGLYGFFSSDYVFAMDHCTESKYWIDDKSNSTLSMSMSECSLKSETPKFEDTKICVSESYGSLFDGEYIWQNFESILTSSIYYNAANKMYIFPYITDIGQYQYHITGENSMTYAKCNVSGKEWNIAECIGKWYIYFNNTWNLDVDMIITSCQDICIVGWFFGSEWLTGTYTFSHFNKAGKTNVYFCKQCFYFRDDEFVYNGTYLYGLDDGAAYAWRLGRDYNAAPHMSQCSPEVVIPNDNYIYNINDCMGSDATWLTGPNLAIHGNDSHNGHVVIPLEDLVENIKISKCNADLSDSCGILAANSKLSRTFWTEESYQRFAIGFDLNIVSDSLRGFTNILIIEYLCNKNINATNDSYNFLTSVDYKFKPIDSTITNIIYSLPKLCDNSSSISISFSVSDLSESITVYIDNIYLYYNVDNTIFFDNMDSDSEWVYS
eukprot:53913_1